MKNKLKKGQQVWFKDQRGYGTKQTTGTISKTGTKYFEIEEIRGIRFLVDNLEVDGYSSVMVFLSEKDFEDYFEKQNLQKYCTAFFSKWHAVRSLSFESLKELKKIIEPYETQNT